MAVTTREHAPSTSTSSAIPNPPAGKTQSPADRQARQHPKAPAPGAKPDPSRSPEADRAQRPILLHLRSAHQLTTLLRQAMRPDRGSGGGLYARRKGQRPLPDRTDPSSPDGVTASIECVRSSMGPRIPRCSGLRPESDPAAEGSRMAAQNPMPPPIPSSTRNIA